MVETRMKETLGMIEMIKSDIDIYHVRTGYYFQHNLNNHMGMIKLLRNLQERFYQFPLDIISYDLEKEMCVILNYTKCIIKHKIKFDGYDRSINGIEYSMQEANKFILVAVAAL